MSDLAQGPGWWQASDGKWYPPSPPAAPPTSSKVTAALVCAILSFAVCPVVLAIVALVLAKQAADEITAAGGDAKADSTLRAARIIAWVNIILLGVVVGFALIAIVAVAILGQNADVKLQKVGSAIEIARYFWLRF